MLRLPAIGRSCCGHFGAAGQESRLSYAIFAYSRRRSNLYRPSCRQEGEVWGEDAHRFLPSPLSLRQVFAHIGRVKHLEIARMKMRCALVSLSIAAGLFAGAACAQEGPDLIFRRSTDFKLLTPNDKLATYVVDDPLIEGVACAYTAHEKGGVAGMFGVAEQTSEISLSCSQYAPIKLRAGKEKEKFAQGETVVSERRSLLFKQMHISRGCDIKRNMLIYMVYSDRLIDGSPENSTAAVAIQPWGGAEVVKCADWIR